jgi:hypothetical protein
VLQMHQEEAPTFVSTPKKFVLLCFTKNSIRITTKFHVLWEWNQNSKIKFVVYQKNNLWFSTTKYLQPFLFPQNYVFNNEILFPKSSLLGSPKSQHHDSKPTRIQNSNQQCSMSSPCPKCLVHLNHVIILPL